VSTPPIIRRLIVSAFETNCWVVGDPTTREALIIDPGDFAENIIEAVRADGLNVRAIVDTHGHADHIGANGRLKTESGCPIMIHESDAPYLSDPNLNLSAMFGESEPLSPPADRLLRDGDEILVGGLVFRVIHTPGHTPGGICLLLGDVLFAGDTLFAGSIGRTDFPNGSHEQLIHSIRERLLSLPDDVVVYSGHGPETTIGIERASNPFL
jgi:hydroxyacylglutathione hydrolase